MLDAKELHQLSKMNLPREEFCGRILQRLVETTGANAAVLWNCSKKPYQPISTRSNGPLIPLKISQDDHSRILDQVLAGRKNLLLRPQANGATGDPTGNANPTILLSMLENSQHEVIELVVYPDHQQQSDQDMMTTLQSASEIAATQNQHPNANARSISLNDFGQYVHSIHSSQDIRDTCNNIANETRLLLDCDRVSVVRKQRGKFQIVAISGQPSVNRRSNTVQLLQKLSQRVLRTDSEFWYPAEQELSPQIKDVLDEYLTNSATRSLVIRPVRTKKETEIEDPDSYESTDNPVIAGIVIEHSNELWERSAVEPTIEFVSAPAADALRNAKRQSDIFLYPLWYWMGKSRILTAPRVWPKILLGMVALVLAALFLLLYQVPFYVSAEGVLLPENRSWVFAGMTGEVESVNVQHNSLVAAGEPLLKLKNEHLAVQIAETRGRINVLNERKRSIEKSSLRIAANDDSESRTAEQSVQSIVAELNALREKSNLLTRMVDKTLIKSPIAGQVITWDAKRKLTGRTVRPEQQLLEIADLDGPWIVELEVPNRRVGHLLRGLNRSEEEPLQVKFTLAADPTESCEGTITYVSNAIQFADDKSQVVKVRVAIADNNVPIRQAKTGVTAKIYCGYDTSIGYLWLHDIPESFRRYVSFFFQQ